MEPARPVAPTPRRGAGAPTVVAAALAAALLASGGTVFVLNASGALDRKALARLVFAHFRTPSAPSA
jgi:hypothetical protein